MTRRRELPPGLGEAFAVAAARASGATARRLDAHDLDAPFRGARMLRHEAPASTEYQRRDHELGRLCAAYMTVAAPETAFSHITAARLFGMPVPERLITTTLDVVTPGQPPRARGVKGRRWSGGQAIDVGALRVVRPELVWLQLAGLVTFDELIVAGDYLVRRKRPLSTLEEMAAVLTDSAGRRGLAAARSALAEVRAGTDSPRETRMRLVIVRAGHPEPVVCYRVHHDGYFIGTPDLAYPHLRIAIEYQGAGHAQISEFENDIFRLELFHEADWQVIQVTRRLLAQRGWLAERVRRAIAARG